MKMKVKHSTSSLMVMSLLIGLEIILTRFLSINTPVLRMGFGFLPVATIGILYGPLWAGLCYAIGDFLGLMLFATAPFFPGFTLSAFLTGVTYGAILHNKPVTWKRTLMASAIVCIVINLGLDTLWLYILMNQAVVALLPFRLLKVFIMLPIQVLLIPLLWERLFSKIPLMSRS